MALTSYSHAVVDCKVPSSTYLAISIDSIHLFFLQLRGSLYAFPRPHYVIAMVGIATSSLIHSFEPFPKQ